MASSKPKGFKSWTMATPIRKADNIMSSKAAERGEKGFFPSFEKDPNINMNFIMSNEYWRIWFKERENYERDFYFKEQTRREESKIKRRFVQRKMPTEKKKKTLPIISLKRFLFEQNGKNTFARKSFRFANPKSKVDAKRDEVKPKKEEEKPAVVEEEEYEPEF